MLASREPIDAIVVGGGLGGLAAGACLARAGCSVVLLERSSTLGGRAITHERNGFRLNLGPHALYRRGAGAALLRELGVRWSAGVPSAAGGYAIDRGRLHALPGGFVSLLTTSLFGAAAKLETARLLASIDRLDARALDGTTVRRFLDDRIRHPDVRRLVAALFRLATYANDPERQSAGSAVEQLQLALAGNVDYVDGGWQTLVDGLRPVATAAGVDIRTGSGVEAVDTATSPVTVRLRDGTVLRARTVILAAGPETAAALLGGDVARRASEAIPVRAACLDVGLARLPVPRARFALGIDRPLYFSLHSAVAKLAPPEAAVIHAAKYLATDGPPDPKADERELEALLDLVQPGWREVTVERRFLPAMVVSNALPLAAAGGYAGRPAPALPGVEDVYLVGDWVGPEGHLVDATLASARRAAELAGRRLAGRAAA
jgi:phytoene dehydrogenase-like protein